jgi:proteic killer suppression protein
MGIPQLGMLFRLAIRTFASESVHAFFEQGRLGARIGWSKVARIVARKLDMLDYATELRDLGSPPGNRLEALKGRWGGFHSIRVNDQWRVVFRWSQSGPEDVDVVDYH